MPDIDKSAFASIDLTPELLDRLFGRAENYGEIEEDTGDGRLFPDGTRWSECTNWANYVQRVLGNRAVSYGFSYEDNAHSQIARTYGGHDFVVVDKRWLVDGWLRDVVHESDSMVFDLHDPVVADEVERLYGPQDFWGEGCHGLYEPNAYARELAMDSARFQEILDAHLASTPTP